MNKLSSHNLLGALQAGAGENDEVDSAVPGDAEQVPSAATSAQPEKAGSEQNDAQTEGRDSELTKPEAE